MTSSSTGPERIAANGLAATFAYAAVEMFLKNGLQCSDLIMSGVLPRFPELQFVSVESGIGWVPFVLEAADHSYLDNRGRDGNEWELLPSEYFARQVYATYWFETVAPTRLLGEIPVDRILFETDYPHPTCLFGNVHEKDRDQPLGRHRRAAPTHPLAERRRPLPGRRTGLIGVAGDPVHLPDMRKKLRGSLLSVSSAEGTIGSRRRFGGRATCPSRTEIPANRKREEP